MTTNAETQNDTHWILLRGLARESRHWGKFAEELKAAVESKSGARAVVDVIDLPGSGRYSEMRAPLTIRATTDFVRSKFLEIRSRGGYPKNVRLIAMSLGGMVATDWLERWPNDFGGAVLMNTSMGQYSPIYRRLTLEAVGRLAKIIATKDAHERELAVLHLVSNRRDLDAATSNEWLQIALERPVSPENFTRQLLAAARYKPRFEKPAAPVLILNSAMDRMVHHSCSDSIAAKWGSKQVTHESAGHDLTLDDGPWAAAQVAVWSSELSLASVK